jgi:lactate permease
VPSFIALSLAALITYGFRVFYFPDTDFLLLHAGVIQGILSALTPIFIIWGALFLFQTLENSYALSTIREWISYISTNKIAQIMIIGWAFIFFIEGVSGFGTPIALAAPLLVGIGFKPLQTVIFCLIMDTIPVSFGAVGTPTWFGFSPLGLSPDQLLEIGKNTALIHFFIAIVIPLWALRILMPWQEIIANWKFIALSILSCVIPMVFVAQISTEFPTLIGGTIGLIVTIFLAHFHIGIQGEKHRKKFHIQPPQLLKAFSRL